MLASWGTATHLAEVGANGTALDPTNIALGGLEFGQLALAVLGVLVIGGEYSSGSIKASLAAVPQRLMFLGAKLTVFTLVAMATGIVTSFAAFYAGMIFFDQHHAGVSLGDPHVLRAVIGAGLLMAVSGLLGLAIGTLLRHTAGAITIAVGLLFVVPIILTVIPAHIVQDINEYFLDEAGQHVTETVRATNAVGPWPGFFVYVAETILLLIVAAILLQRRDA